MWSVALTHSSYAQSRDFHVALTTAGLFTIVNEFAMIFAVVLRVCVFLKYMAVDTLIYVSAPGPFGDRGDTPRWGQMAGTAACCLLPCTGCRPQPRGSGGDVKPRKDTRQDR